MINSVQRVNLAWRLGEPHSVNVTVKNPSNQPIDISMATEIKWHLKRKDRLGSPYKTLTIGDGIELVNLTVGKYKVIIPSEATVSLDEDMYFHCSSVTIGPHSYTVMDGDVKLTLGC